jgi:L-lactate dehydrogenase complex protein LldE
VRIALFTTCIGDTIAPEASRATVEVLERLGHEVVFPAAQTCRGQLHLNSGYAPEADALARRFARIFGDYDVVVSPSSSCVGTVREHYGNANVFELSELLVHRLGVEDVGASFPHRVAYHPTCHSLRVTRVGDAPLRLLRNVRGLELVELPRASECCGFGGTFSVKYPGISSAIDEAKVRNVVKSGAACLLAGDLGCLLHIAGRLSRDGSTVECRHVAEVLAGMIESPAIGQARKAG